MVRIMVRIGGEDCVRSVQTAQGRIHIEVGY